MAFIPRRKPTDIQIRRAVIANVVGSSALTVTVGDAIVPGATGHSKYVTNNPATGPVLGIVVGLVFQNKFMELNSVVGVNTASTAAGALQTNVHNDNETTGYWSVDYIPAYIPMEYEVDVDAAVGTTTDSDGQGYFSILSGTPGKLHESSFVIWSTISTGTSGTSQFFSYGSPANLANTKKVVGHLYSPQAL
jgi:hypothetical protein